MVPVHSERLQYGRKTEPQQLPKGISSIYHEKIYECFTPFKILQSWLQYTGIYLKILQIQLQVSNYDMQISPGGSANRHSQASFYAPSFE